ncbi:MAG: four helix bundle protein [Ferruginibacter sp.]|nr:four helix bundle protein [Ferruginibacter sp.]
MKSTYSFSFEKLEIWNLARALVVDVYSITEKLPEKEKFGLISQLKRSMVSVASNIAEGSTRSSFKEQAKFSSIAYGSLIEVLNHLIISKDLNFINQDELFSIREKIVQLSLKINNIRAYQVKRSNE